MGGVGQVVINGGQKRAVNVWIDADRLAAYKIPIMQVRDAVARQNSEIPGGRVDEGVARSWCCARSAAFPIPSSSTISSSPRSANAPIRIRDIGHAEDGHKEQRTFATYDGLRRSRSNCAGSPARTRSKSSTT